VFGVVDQSTTALGTGPFGFVGGFFARVFGGLFVRFVRADAGCVAFQDDLRVSGCSMG
jgi:hypothetical protein